MILVLGKSGSGKTFITSHLEKMGLKRSISCTTREIRPTEKNNVDYEFIDHKEFEKRLANGEFIEYKVFRGNYYGTPKKNIATSDLILSGGEISPELIPYIECTYYIDTPLTIRYNGMQIRKSSYEELFDRIHGENELFLFDNPTKIFYSDHTVDITNEVYQSIKDKDLVKARNFKEFIEECVDIYKQSDYDNESQLMQFLNYEEFLLRKMYLEDNLTRDEYDEQIERFLFNHHFPYEQQEEHFDIELDGNKTYCKKLLKRKN